MRLVVGDIVINTRTNMVGCIASIDEAIGQCRLEHETRTSLTPFKFMVPYTGRIQPGEEFDPHADDAPVFAPDVDDAPVVIEHANEVTS